MKSIFKYMYYVLHRKDVKNWGAAMAGPITPLWGISFMMFVNIITLFLPFHKIIKTYITYEQGKIISIVCVTIIVVINYYYFVKKGEYKKIIAFFNKITPEEKKRINLKMSSYIIFSFGLLILVGRTLAP